VKRALVPLLLLGACHAGDEAPFRGRGVVLVVLDSLHSAHLGCYGHGRATSPVIDRLAREGVRFEECRAQSSWTLPSVATILTGAEQERHALRSLEDRLHGDLATLPELFARAGYRTAAVLQNPLLAPSTGLHAGFAEVQRFGWGAADAVRAVEAACELLRAPREAPLFLYVHLVPPHMPYQPPAPHRGSLAFAPGDHEGSIAECRRVHKADLPSAHPDVQRLALLYDEHVAFADTLVGRIVQDLESAQAAERPLLVVTSDHGEAFMQHGAQGHNAHVFDEMLRVPLVLFAPGVLASRTVAGPASLVDLLPTLAELAGLNAPGGPGRSLASLVLGTGEPARLARRSLFLSSRYKADPAQLELGLLEQGQKLVHSGRDGVSRLYDLGTDPFERRDVAGEHHALVQDMERRLLAWYAARTPARAANEPLDPVPLRELGYVDEQ
jgi:arylsulfatase